MSEMFIVGVFYAIGIGTGVILTVAGLVEMYERYWKKK